jgi:biotin operon repressor
LEASRLLEVALAGLPAGDRHCAIERVPEHSEIFATASRLSPHTREVRIPAVGAPTGRPLRDGDLRQVTWTIDHPEDDRIGSPIERRRQRLLRLLIEADDEGAVPSIDQLAEALDVSESTVRRDLTALRQAGHLVTTRGQRSRVS